MLDVTDAFKAAIEGAADLALALLPNRSIECVAVLFEKLWIENWKPKAFHVLKPKIFENVLTDVFRLFKYLRFVTLREPLHFLFLEPTDNPKIIALFTHWILAFLKDKPAPEFRRQLETALFQNYCFQNDLPNLMALVQSGAYLSEAAMESFFGDSVSVPRAFYLGVSGHSVESIAMFQSLCPLDNSSLEAVASVFIMSGHSWEFVESQIRWLFGQSPIHACQVLSHDHVVLKSALAFAKAEFPQFYLRVLYLCLFRKELLSASALVNQFLLEFVALLQKLPPDFTAEAVQFCACVIRNRSAPRDEIDAEMGSMIGKVLREFADLVEMPPLIACVERIPVRQVRLEIYRAKGSIAEAIDLLWRSEEDIPACSAFCRDARDPTAAFEVLVRHLGAKVSDAKRIDLLFQLIAENMDLIDIAQALEIIGADEDIEAIVPLIDQAYRQVVAVRKDTDLSAALAESDLFESEFEKRKAQSVQVRIKEGTVCAKCEKDLGLRFVVRGVDGLLYHKHCSGGDE
jgi:hypothetical protein